MKTSIPSGVWEKKKALIARLYKDEEWPLKQVIKQIRTKDFNPSETQLRSRLKKWRVTKPSRQIRKKPIGEQGENDDEDEEDAAEEMLSPVEMRNNIKHEAQLTNTAATTIPTPPQSQHSQSDLATTREWYPTDVWVQSQHEQHMAAQTVVTTQPEIITTQSWAASVSAPSPITTTTSEQHQSHGAASQISTPVVTQFPSHHSLPAYDLSHQQQQSPPSSIPPPSSSHVMSPTNFVSPTYAMTPITHPQPGPQTATHWSTGNDFIEADSNPTAAIAMQPASWYTGIYEAANAAAAASTASNAAYYQRTMNPAAVTGYTPVMQHMGSPQDIGASYQVSPQAQAQAQAQPMTTPGYHGFDEGISVRPWRRAISSHCQPESVPGAVRVDRQGRQRKQLSDRKRKESATEEMDLLVAQQQQHLQSMQPPVHPAVQPVYQHQPQQHPHYIAGGHPHQLIPHEIYAYAGHEQLLQRPLGH